MLEKRAPENGCVRHAELKNARALTVHGRILLTPICRSGKYRRRNDGEGEERGERRGVWAAAEPITTFGNGKALCRAHETQMEN